MTPPIVHAVRQGAADAADAMTMRAVEIEQAAERIESGAGETVISTWTRFLAAWVRLGAEIVRVAA